jgi:hypothetical protein
MLSGINSSSRHIIVHGGSSSAPYISPGSVGAGMIRWNPNMNQLEVNDGNSWMPFHANYATIELTPETEGLLEWARKKRAEEQELETLAKDHPAVKAALEAVQRAKEQLKLIKELSIEHESI